MYHNTCYVMKASNCSRQLAIDEPGPTRALQLRDRPSGRAHLLTAPAFLRGVLDALPIAPPTIELTTNSGSRHDNYDIEFIAIPFSCGNGRAASPQDAGTGNQ
jgi:hypothetical protein